MGINEYIQIGNNIKKARIKKGLTQQAMAEALSIGVSSYANYENNYREPNLEIINRIADILEVSIDDLVIESFTKKYNIPAIGSAQYDFAPGEEQLAIDVLNSFEKLNTSGKEEAAKRVEELTYIEKYKK